MRFQPKLIWHRDVGELSALLTVKSAKEEAEMWLQEDTGLESGGQAPHTPLFFSFLGRGTNVEEYRKMRINEEAS
jgi:hypothetical protein